MDYNDDNNISFDSNGYCNYCSSYFKYVEDETNIKKHSLGEMLPLIEKIKQDKKNNKYDCIVGISGGTDSAYLIYKLVETATKNIEMLLKKLNVDLYTYVNNWEEFKDLQLSFFKAGVIDIELLTEQAIIALLYKTSVKFKTKYIFTGHNVSTEFILPKHWYHWKLDALNIKSIHKKFGTKKIKTFPLMSFWEQYYHGKFRKTQMISLLNYINYDKNEAKKILSDKFDWKDYGAKHNESVFTRFYQNYILPVKFNVDKRKAHLSSIICSGQISREQALNEIETKPWETEQTIQDKEYVLKKLEINRETFDQWMKEEPVSHFAYASYLTRHDKIIKDLKKIFKKN